MKSHLLIAILLACAVMASGARRIGTTHSEPECIWQNFTFDEDVVAWEFQLQPHRHHVRNRATAIRKLERLMEKLTADPDSGFQLLPDSRWMALFREHTFQVSSRHGHPLHGKDRKDVHLPWNGVAYIRLRSYKVLTPAGAYVPTAMPGTADLTLKMKKVDPQAKDDIVSALGLEGQVAGAQLSGKVENDVHCDHQRVTFSPLYKPVSPHLNISSLQQVGQYFPQLGQLVRLEEDEPLPFIHDVWRAKVVWTVIYNGVVGEANLVIKYNTTFEDVVAGGVPKNGEVSLRIRRQVAEAQEEELEQALRVLGRAMQVFRDAGWDGKTPPATAPGSHGGGQPAAADADAAEDDDMWSGSQEEGAEEPEEGDPRGATTRVGCGGGKGAADWSHAAGMWLAHWDRWKEQLTGPHRQRLPA